ncbi:MAG: hypothetical protein K8F36_14545, partial [Melioribacteraceae bacterium]|nr:hypothetical protein [Melioribacteraceae bacterium]
MKSLLLISMLLISTNFFAQERVNAKSELVSDQVNQWMTNISTNAQMRLQMMQMIIDQTVDKPGEMQLLVNTILNNAEMKKMIRNTSFQDVNDTRNPTNMPS